MARSKGYISKGQRRNVARWVRKSARREYIKDTLQRALNQANAFKKGKNVVLTIENFNDKETNKKFIRVNARERWHTGFYIMKSENQKQ